MMPYSPLLQLVMVGSCVLQFLAAFAAIRLIRPSGASLAWILLACGFLIQGVRRLVALLHVSNGQSPGDFPVEVLGLVISLFMFIGILKFRPLFDNIRHDRDVLLSQQNSLVRTNRELEGFVSTVSHDLRNPLTVIIGYAEYLGEQNKDILDPASLQAVQEIETQATRMTALLEDLLALAKVGFIEQPENPVDVGRLVNEVVDELRPQIVQHNAAVKVENLPDLILPETLLTEIFENLIINAIKYACSDGGEVTVWGERRQDAVTYYVRDHGPGVPEGDRTDIFDMFYRGAKGPAVKGTGMGLAIVKKIVELYNGRVWVEETPQGGCTFVLEFPQNVSPQTSEVVPAGTGSSKRS